MKAVFKHELSLYYHGLLAYVFGAFLLEFIGIGAMMYNINRAVANFEYALGTFCIGFVALVPILTMRVMAEEKKQKTDQLLSLLPITGADIVLGKYFAMAVVFIAPMLVACVYPFIFSLYGDVYLPTSYGALFAFICLGLALIAIGMFISSLTESQGMAAGICVVVMLFCYYSADLADYISSTAFNVAALLVLSALLALLVRRLTRSDVAGLIILVLCVAAVAITWFVSPDSLQTLLPDLMSKLSLFERFYTFVNGVFDVTAIIYYASVAVFFLFLCVQSWEKKRYNG
ncbi:MAG TPA: ABC transporter permease [Candidatus Gemmiger excrementigallinarum]|uniref:ABC transporter permease n=1 Tax=Candidatus Gemmiger excrementigallinarum TaxID=2838609 RepID=A0A9D2JBA2_9FIRM|nr:ABC transporter permease [Candidatus Gemmiger excrementigallinarum]